jgi:Domain of unknown function (DUF4158)
MASIQDTAYPRLKNNPTEKDLPTLYTPTMEELELAKRVTTKSVTCLNFLVLLKVFQRLGYGVALVDVPASITCHIVTSAQLPMSRQKLSQYDASETRRRRLSVIRGIE